MYLTYDEKKVLRAVGESNMNIAAAAKGLCRHRNSVVYVLERIEKRTGLNPRCFRDLVRLLGGTLPEGV